MPCSESATTFNWKSLGKLVSISLTQFLICKAIIKKDFPCRILWALNEVIQVKKENLTCINTLTHSWPFKNVIHHYFSGILAWRKYSLFPIHCHLLKPDELSWGLHVHTTVWAINKLMYGKHIAHGRYTVVNSHWKGLCWMTIEDRECYIGK